jgi:hypothetical protein
LSLLVEVAVAPATPPLIMAVEVEQADIDAPCRVKHLVVAHPLKQS